MMSKQIFRFSCRALPFIIIFSWAFFPILGCLKSGRRTGEEKTPIIQRIKNDCELTIGKSATLDQFMERNADYNPSWIAKILISNDDALKLRKELDSKVPYRLKRKGALLDSAPWWKPMPSSEKFEYMTSSNAPVLLLLSEAVDNAEVFVQWSAP